MTAFALLATFLTVNAQVFVGGSLGLNLGGGKNSSYNSEGSGYGFGFNISPQVGYYLNNDLAIGVRVSLDNNWSNNKATYPDEPTNDRVSKSFRNYWGIHFFGRYKLIELGIENLSLLAEGLIGVQGSSNKQTENEITTKYPGSTVYSINARPVLSYKLSDRLDVLAYCDFLTIGYNYQTQKGSLFDQKSKYHSFNLGFNSFSDLSIGFLYKF